ncbi:MAG: Rha family transcriptional regulator [Acetobacter malorum]|uniref:Rha family transcriptional regulator n=1 Tax=Acetobacter malorum TaxID=178901 RepID=UPI0039EA6256
MGSIITPSAPNSSPTMSSKEIAELTGKRHDHVIRDIKSMLEQVIGHSPNLGNEQIQGVIVEKDHRGFIKTIHLDHSHTITLITGYDARQRKKVVDRWLELEHSGNSPTASKPKRIRKPAFDTAFSRCMNVVALLPNVDENQKVLMAARGTHTLTGINPLEVMGYAALPATTEDNYQTPTQLGKPFGLPPRRVNQILVDAGLQVHTPGSSTGSDWSMTDKGLAYGKMFDTSRRGGKGSQQQLKWKPSVAEFLRPFSQTPA